jgi:hypothetical protein
VFFPSARRIFLIVDALFLARKAAAAGYLAKRGAAVAGSISRTRCPASKESEMKIRIVSTAAAALFLSTPAFADFVTLKDGERIEGIVVEHESEIEIRLDIGTLTVDRAEVASIERAPSSLEQIEKRRSQIKTGDVEGLYRLGVEAEKLGLSAQARGLFREVIAAQTDHKGARAALGYRQHEGRWMTEDEFMTSRGYVQRLGQWVTAEAAQALDAAEAARKSAEVERRDRDRIARLEREVQDARSEAERARIEAASAAAFQADYGTYVPIYGAHGYTVQRTTKGTSLTINVGGPGWNATLQSPPVTTAPPGAPASSTPPAPAPKRGASGRRR